MRYLHVFGPYFGLPDPSPFCIKGLVLMKMSGLEFETRRADLRRAPKGKAPWLDDNGTVVADTTLMREHLETTYGVDFDADLSAEQKGIAWALEKLCEDNLYWATSRERWLVDENFDAGPVIFFKDVPAFVRPLVTKFVRSKVRKAHFAHGLGRHTPSEVTRIACRGFDAIAGVLGDKTWITGETPCGCDASVFATIASATCELFDSPVARHIATHPNLIAYRDRGMAHWFPEHTAD